MKKLLFLLMIGLMMFPAAMYGKEFYYEYEGTTLKYETLEDGTAQVAYAQENISGDVKIPEKVEYYNGTAYQVTSIAHRAFDSCTGLTSVEIPNSVTLIGGYAFAHCTGLTSVEIPNSVTSIDHATFWECTGLTSVEISNSVTSIGESAFQECTGLTSIKIPNSVTSIDNWAFSGCTGLRYVLFQTTDIELGKEIFHYCMLSIVFYPEGDDTNNLQSIDARLIGCDVNTTSILKDGTILSDDGKTLLIAGMADDSKDYIIPEGIEIIKTCAFDNSWGKYDNLKSLTIPASVRLVEADAFATLNIERVNFNDWNAWYNQVVLENLASNPYRFAELSGAYVGGVRLTTPPDLKEGITEIPNYVNAGLQYKNELELPTTLKRIGAYAFWNNKELYAVYLNNGLEEIGEHAFDGCELLENQLYPESLRVIEDGAYMGCSNLTEVILPEGLTELGSLDETAVGVFSNCANLERAVLVIDSDVVGTNMFRESRKLEKVYFPLQLKTIGNGAFYNCYALDEVKFPATLESIGNEAFFMWNYWSVEQYDYEGRPRGSITNIVLPNSVTKLGEGAFAGQNIQNLTIGSGLEEIGGYAFKGNSLILLNLSEGLKSIGYGAFENCESNLGSVTIPATVEEIAENAFIKTGIRELVMPETLQSFPKGSCGTPSILTLGKDTKEIDAEAFSFDRLRTLRVKAITPPSVNAAFPLTNDQNDALTLVVNNGRKNYYETNARWKQIDNIIEDSETDIVIYLNGQYALAEEIRTTTGLYPSMVSKMKVVGPLTATDLRVINENMVSLTSLDMSEVTNVTSLPAGQFENSLLAEIKLPSNLEEIGDRAFAGCRLLNLTSLPATVKSIGHSAFENCSSIKLTELPESLETCGYWAFANCINLREMRIGDKCREIGQGAFAGCVLMETIDLSETGIEAINYGTFSGCTELDEVLLPESVTIIADNAFANTSLYDLSFLPAGVTEIGAGAFSNCRRLLSATYPSKVESVRQSVFENCPRMLALSLPAAITSVEPYVVNNNKRLANISSANPDAPDAAIGAFDNVRVRYVSLTVPVNSFRAYLNAPQWGKFQSIQNKLVFATDEGIDSSVVDAKEYEEVMEEIALDIEEDAAAEEYEEYVVALRNRRAVRRAAALENAESKFASLFDGAQICTGNEGDGLYIFLHPKDGVTITSVLVNDKEMVDQVTDNRLYIPNGLAGTIHVKTDFKGTDGVETISDDVDFSAPYDIYNLSGAKVGHDITVLEPGIYILRQGKASKKVSVM